MINDWRQSIELEPINLLDGPALLEMLKVPVTYCWSPGLVPRPRDWPEYVGKYNVIALLDHTLIDAYRRVWLLLP